MPGETHKLGIHDNEVLAEWFVYNLSQEQRFKLAAELPVIYGRMYPDVAPSRIASFVDDTIRAERKKGDAT